ncbi:hypothetical protein Tco_0062037, partial [Tanacetum coccineum]
QESIDYPCFKVLILGDGGTGMSLPRVPQSLDAVKQKAAELEADGSDDLDFGLNILAIGKAGVGKSATINSNLWGR